MQVVTDGEFRRGSYWGRFVERTDGFEIKMAGFKFRDDQGDEVKSRRLRKCEDQTQAAARAGRILFLHEVSERRARSPCRRRRPCFLSLQRLRGTPRPILTMRRSSPTSPRSSEQEIAEFVKAGCRYIQLDEVAVALLCDPTIREQVAREGRNPDELKGLYIKSINDAVANCPSDVVFGIHMCRGNFKGHYLAAGGYEKVAERFFAETEINHFLLEYDTARAGDFAPLRFVPKGKGVVLGLISTKTPVLENKDALKRRVDDASRSIDLDRLAIGPQCGFASTVAGNPVTEAHERAKLALAVETAREIWPRG